jgi:hypothetical protein
VTDVSLPKRGRGRPKKAHPTSTAVALPEQWCDNPDIYPDTQEILTALQDLGKKQLKVINGNRQEVTSYTLIQKLSTKIYQNIQSIYKPDGLTKNTSRGRESLAGLVLMSRRLIDVTSLDVSFHRFARNGQVFCITNNPIHGGLDVPIKEFQANIVASTQKAKACRSTNDGLRLALTLLDPKNRDSVAIIMTNKKDRTQSDITGDHVLHFFEQLLHESFMNPSYRPPRPEIPAFGEIDVDERCQWDPDDPKIFEVDRTAAWLVETWKTYVRRKYKLALDKWNKETGGGNGQAWSFINYCEKDSRWLVAVFLKDIENNYLLASNAGGRMPSHLQMECASDPTLDVSSMEESSGGRATAGKRAAMEAQAETKKLKSEISQAVSLLTSMCKKKEEDMKKQEDSAEDTMEYRKDKLFIVIAQLNSALKDQETLNSMSPTTRDDYVQCITPRRKVAVRKMLQLEKVQEEQSL